MHETNPYGDPIEDDVETAQPVPGAYDDEDAARALTSCLNRLRKVKSRVRARVVGALWRMYGEECER